MYILPMTFVSGAACAARARARTEIVENILLSSAEACNRRRWRDCKLDGCRGNRGSPLDFISLNRQAFRWHREKRKFVRFGRVRPNAANKGVPKDNSNASF